MKFDLHIHSKYSYDSLLSPEKIIKIAKKKGLNGAAITDHNTIKGGIEGLKANNDTDFQLIVGAEIKTNIGDIIGLGLNEEIKCRNWEDVIDEIHSQGGVAILPHPYRGHKLVEELAMRVDVIEVFNARTPKELNKKAYELALKFQKGISAGSDAHVSFEIGRGTVVINSDLINELLLGGVEINGKESPYLLVHGMSFVIEKLRKIRVE